MLTSLSIRHRQAFLSDGVVDSAPLAMVCCITMRSATTCAGARQIGACRHEDHPARKGYHSVGSSTLFVSAPAQPLVPLSRPAHATRMRSSYMKTCGARYCGSTRRVRVSAWLHDRPWRLTRLTRRVHCERLETASVMHPPHSGTCPRCCHMGRGAVTWGDVGAANRAHTSTGGRADAAHPCPPSRGEDPGYCCPWEALRIPERAPRPSINCWGTIRRSSWLSPWLRRPADAQPRPTRSQGVGPYWVGQRVFACWGVGEDSSWLSPWLHRPADAQPRCWAILGRPASLCLLGRWRRRAVF